MSYHGNGSSPGEWTLRLYPDPPRDLGWLDLSTTPGEPVVRIDLNRPPAAAQVTVRRVTTSTRTTDRRNAIPRRRYGYATAADAGMPPASANITRATSAEVRATLPLRWP